MRKRLPPLIALVVSVALAATWLLVSNDWWPLDERNFPATAVWAFNGAVGSFLMARGVEEEVPMPALTKDGFTVEEWEQIQNTLRTDPRFRERAALNRSGAGYAWGGLPAASSAWQTPAQFLSARRTG